MYKVLILGGYGNFGKRIAELLSKNTDIELLIAGRNSERSTSLCHQLREQQPKNHYQSVVMDITSPDFESQLKAISPNLVIHTSGPFQGQDHKVPKACIEAGCHYIDLADDRRFVCDIEQLNQAAQQKGILLVSGASSVPGLSSVVVDHFLERFIQLESIYVGIAPGNQAERGEATIRGILSYTGHPYPRWQDGRWQNSYGWMSTQRLDLGGRIGKRWLANVDIPDLELFPERYPSVRDCQFQAGLELPVLHLSMTAMAWLVRLKLVSNWAPLTRASMAVSHWFDRCGTDNGAMRVNLRGLDQTNKPISIDWTLYAYGGVGPYIPTLSAIILANRLIKGELKLTGAKPCLGLFTLDDVDQYASQWQIFHETQINID